MGDLGMVDAVLRLTLVGGTMLDFGGPCIAGEQRGIGGCGPRASGGFPAQSRTLRC